MVKIGKDVFKKLFARLLCIQYRINLMALGVDSTTVDEYRSLVVIYKTILTDNEQIKKNQHFHSQSKLDTTVHVYRDQQVHEFVQEQLNSIHKNYRLVVSRQRRLLDRHCASRVYQDFLEVKQAFENYSFAGKVFTITECSVVGVNPFGAQHKQARSVSTLFYFTNDDSHHSGPDSASGA